MSLLFPPLSIPSLDSSTSRPISPCSSSPKDPPSSLQLVTRNFGGGGGLCRRFCGLKLWTTQRFNIWHMNRKSGPLKEFMTPKNQNFPNETKRTSEPEESSCMSSNLIPSQM